MIVDVTKFNRNELTKSQREFLQRLVPWSLFMQKQTREKARYFKKIPDSPGLFPSIVIAHLIIQSNWGSHPIAQEKYKSKEANNLSLLPLTKYWDGVKLKFDGLEFKAFKDYEDFFIHYSDLIVFSGHYLRLLETSDIQEQIFTFSIQSGLNSSYNERMKALIDLYSLGEFDILCP